MKLLTRNAKTVRTEEVWPEWIVRALQLAPAKRSGYEVCAGRSPGCTGGCCNTSGNGRFDMVQDARIARTKFLFENRPVFMAMLNLEIARRSILALREGKKLCVRLNCFSDLDWADIMRAHPGVQFNEYTKIYPRMVAWLKGMRPANEHLTWSRSEQNTHHTMAIFKLGGRVACVTDKLAVGGIVDGDVHDLRFLDPVGSKLVYLHPKGYAKRDKTGFVQWKEIDNGAR